MDADQNLDEQLCFALYSAARVAASAYRDELSALGLTYTQYVTLLALWERDGVTVSALGERLRLDSGTLSPLIRRLEGAGLLERRRDQSDERLVTVHVTDEGRALRPVVDEARRRVYEGFNLPVEDAILLRDLANRFSAAHTRTTRTPSGGTS
ncbi:MarR family transcriptional regulator [Tsukamurella pulmonis]|uniref:DNA-binding transcriptional regulator, MarR family n=1 Tax=Tsukamurella pulmonis TaxID=47312 RepID=A0A1H1G740_9ACTN|nr:MarR family transcriptional regulator [Tsukamurella pulmonis]KXO87862.1 MarR family transcriptional regulator [Tsukamurella pulmonis]KXP13550.1 MarR family transcriptional regulator [Tsukamurella pulmonis]RDH12834.1 MarR family transcriptional regulator [Tsukamurella pulmonis]SDR08963.1 DNA-binding transcriptional regulator, MarR family [Tsukamurella pulmonis]SUP17759.1 Organic hydroperoxide resistance transcriptional regulator [Tsukamurella pulmonis]